MNKQTGLNKFCIWVLLVTITVGISACSGEIGPVYRTWIDFPRQGGKFSSGSPIPITFHLTENPNIAEVVILVNGEMIHRGSPPESGNPVMSLNQEWIPDQPGEYTIEVAAADDQGNTLSRAQVDIIVVGELLPAPPDLSVTDIQLNGNDRISCTFENLGGDVIPAGREVWIDIILGPAESELPPVARSNIGVGDDLRHGEVRTFTTAPLSPIPSWPHLVTCRIDVGNLVGETDEDNNKMMKNLGVNLAAPLPTTETPTPTQPTPTISPSPTSPPPPPTTQSPSPTPTFTDIPDTTPPNISGMSAVPDRIAEEPCAQNTVTISAQVSDPSGVSQVKLFYRAAKGGKIGSWQNLVMSSTGGNGYQISVGPSQISASYSPYGGLNLQYYIKAWDSEGNSGQTSNGSVPLDYCVQ